MADRDIEQVADAYGVIEIPAADWPTALAEAIQTAPKGATIIVLTAAMRELAMTAAYRMNRRDLKIPEVKERQT